VEKAVGVSTGGVYTAGDEAGPHPEEQRRESMAGTQLGIEKIMQGEGEVGE
jgi:hypothetical protein